VSVISNSPRRHARDWLGSGFFWMWFWTGVLALNIVWAVVTVIWLLDSVRNLNLLSLEALLLACGAGFQSTLGMRKADPQDPL
jgi:hypothetical protein